MLRSLNDPFVCSGGSMIRMLISSLLLAALLAACQPVAPIPPVPDGGGTGPTVTETATAVPPTQTPTPEATATPTENPTPEVTPTETFEPIKLGTPESPGICEESDYYSGRMLAQARKDSKPFPSGTKSGRWVTKNGDGPYYEGPNELVSYCIVGGNRIVMMFHIPEDNNPVGRFINLEIDKIEVKYVMDGNTLKRRMIGIMNPYKTGLKQNYEQNDMQWAVDLLYRNIDDGLPEQIYTLLKNDGTFPTQLELELVKGAFTN